MSTGGRFAPKAFHDVDMSKPLARAEPGWSFAGGPEGKTWQEVAEEAREIVLKENEHLKAKSTELSKKLNEAMERAEFHMYMRPWYQEYHDLAKELFGDYEPTFSKFVNELPALQEITNHWSIINRRHKRGHYS